MRRLLMNIRIEGTRELNGDLKVPKYLEERFDRLEPDGYLDPEMGKYVLYFKEGWGYPMGANEYWESIPVMSKKEALEYLRDAEKPENKEDLH